MKLRTTALLLSLSLLAAGCSNSQSTKTETAETESTETENTAANESSTDVKALLNAIVENSADNDKALESWKSVLQTTLDSTENSWKALTDAGYYEYKDENESFVSESYLYRGSRYDAFVTDGDQAVYVSMNDFDNSNNEFLTGDGVFARFGEKPAGIHVKLTSTSGSEVDGTVIDTDDDETEETVSEASLEKLIESASEAAYFENVDPIRNASLYTFTLTEEDGGYVLSAKVTDLEKYREQASVKTDLEDYDTDRIVAALDEVNSAEYKYTFSSEGVLTGVTSQVLHALSALDLETYVDVSNQTAVSAAGDDAISTEAFTTPLDEAYNGSLKAGDSLKIESWR